MEELKGEKGRWNNRDSHGHLFVHLSIYLTQGPDQALC